MDKLLIQVLPEKIIAKIAAKESTTESISGFSVYFDDIAADEFYVGDCKCAYAIIVSYNNYGEIATIHENKQCKNNTFLRTVKFSDVELPFTIKPAYIKHSKNLMINRKLSRREYRLIASVNWVNVELNAQDSCAEIVHTQSLDINVSEFHNLNMFITPKITFMTSDISNYSHATCKRIIIMYAMVGTTNLRARFPQALIIASFDAEDVDIVIEQVEIMWMIKKINCDGLGHQAAVGSQFKFD